MEILENLWKDNKCVCENFVGKKDRRHRIIFCNFVWNIWKIEQKSQKSGKAARYRRKLFLIFIFLDAISIAGQIK